MNKLGVAIGLFVLTLGASIYFTAHPYIATIKYGGCVDTITTQHVPSSVIGEYLLTGGHAKETYPDTTQDEYGCAATLHRAIVPVDLYLLTILFAGLTLRYAIKH